MGNKFIPHDTGLQFQLEPTHAIAAIDCIEASYVCQPLWMPS